MSLQPQPVLQGRYEVVRSIKSGGMGAVYEAIDHKLADTPCAIKEVLTAALQGPDADYILKSFESEMRALAALNHPNIPRVRDYFEVDGHRYIILDLIRGTPLDDEITRGLMEPTLAAADMVEVLDTLAYLHSGTPAVVHRDIKPANLIRDQRDRRIKLVDFGIARAVGSQQLQTMVGTPGYCAPEQMAGRAEPRSDVYSVGVTLAHLVTGRIPRCCEAESLTPQLPDSPRLVAIIAKATQMKVSQRYTGAQEMAHALKDWLKSDECIQRAPTREIGSSPLGTHPPTGSSKGMIGGVAALLLASALLFLSTPPWAGPVTAGSATASPTALPEETPSPRPVARTATARPSKAPAVQRLAPVVRPAPISQRHLRPEPAVTLDPSEGFRLTRSIPTERAYFKQDDSYQIYVQALVHPRTSERKIRQLYADRLERLPNRRHGRNFAVIDNAYWSIRTKPGLAVILSIHPAPPKHYPGWSSIDRFLDQL